MVNIVAQSFGTTSPLALSVRYMTAQCVSRVSSIYLSLKSTELISKPVRRIKLMFLKARIMRSDSFAWVCDSYWQAPALFDHVLTSSRLIYAPLTTRIGWQVSPRERSCLQMLLFGSPRRDKERDAVRVVVQL